MTRRRISNRRGYMAITLRDRGPIGRGLKRAFNAASAKSWEETAQEFHLRLRDKRFTVAHARAAGYALRKGEGLAGGSKAFRRSYTGRKLAKYGHTNPLELTGDTRRKIRFQFSITATNKGGKVSYRGASKFSFRHPKSRIRMNEEFRRLTPEEITLLASKYDSALDEHWKPDEAAAG